MLKNQIIHSLYLCLFARKPVFRVSVKARFKPVSLATETILKIGFSPGASLHMKFSKKRITKALIRLRGCAGWSAPVLFATPEDRFSHDEAHLSSNSSVEKMLKCTIYNKKSMKRTCESWVVGILSKVIFL